MEEVCEANNYYVHCTLTSKIQILHPSTLTLALHREIARWDKIAQIAQMLVGLEGLSVSEEEAGRIKSLWNSLQGRIQGARAPSLASSFSWSQAIQQTV